MKTPAIFSGLPIYSVKRPMLRQLVSSHGDVTRLVGLGDFLAFVVQQDDIIHEGGIAEGAAAHLAVHPGGIADHRGGFGLAVEITDLGIGQFFPLGR